MMPFWKLFLKRTQASSRTFFSWHQVYEVRRVLLSYHSFKQTGICGTVPERKLTPLRPNSGSLCIPKPVSLQKIALDKTICESTYYNNTSPWKCTTKVKLSDGSKLTENQMLTGAY
jgi:hypothetical protein